jgi:hypothetical protein
VFFMFPRKQREQELLASYHAMDEGEPTPEAESTAAAPVASS